jgi:hypothetical protein
MNEPRTITLAEYQSAQAEYEEEYELGETYDVCSFCKQPVVEKIANYDFYRGTGVVLHPHCVGHWMRNKSARDWWALGYGFAGSKHIGDPYAENYDHMGMFMVCLGYGRWT